MLNSISYPLETLLKNSVAKIECTDAGADAYALFAIGSDGDDRFVVELRDEVDLAPPTGVCGLDLKAQLK